MKRLSSTSRAQRKKSRRPKPFAIVASNAADVDDLRVEFLKDLLNRNVDSAREVLEELQAHEQILRAGAVLLRQQLALYIELFGEAENECDR